MSGKLNRAYSIFREEGFLKLFYKIIGYFLGSIPPFPILLREGRAKFLKHTYGRFLSAIYAVEPVNRYCFKRSRKSLRQLHDRDPRLYNILDTAYRYTGLGFYKHFSPVQHPDELADLAEEVARLEPSTILEIGTDRGGTFYVWSRFTDAKTLVSVDIDYSQIERSSLRYQNRPQFMSEFRNDDSLYFVEGNSQSETTRNKVADIIGTSGIDFLFIDGDHSYDGVKRDYNLYKPLMNEGGIIAFHDICMDSNGELVPTFWEEMKAKHETTEIYHQSAFYSFPHIADHIERNLCEDGGIGLIYL